MTRANFRSEQFQLNLQERCDLKVTKKQVWKNHGVGGNLNTPPPALLGLNEETYRVLRFLFYSMDFSTLLFHSGQMVLY